MNHSFDEDIAVKYGINEAILINHIAFWVKQNKLNKRNCYEGRYWTYNSISALVGLFPFFSRETIKRTLSHLKDEKLILAGNFGEDRFNRTNYYTLTDKGEKLVWNINNREAQNEQGTMLKMSESDISNTNIYINNTDITSDITNTASPILSKEEKIDLLFEEFWKAYPNRRKYNKPGCKAKYRHIPDIEKIHSNIMFALEIHKRSKDWTKDNGEYIPAPYVYLNQERWKLVDTRDENQVLADEAAMDLINQMYKKE